jgi:hypothetical protein
MDRVIRYAAYVANLFMLVGVVFLFINAYGQDAYFSLLLAVSPVLSIIALYIGPDLEERRLTRKLSKARLKRELDAFEDDET